MQPLTLKQPLASTSTEFQITAEITAEDCARLGLGNEYIGLQTFGPKRWQTITGKRHNSIKSIYKTEMQFRREGREPRDFRQIVGLEKVESKGGWFGKRDKDIKQFSDIAKFFINGGAR